MKKKHGGKPRRKPYEPPRLVKIEIRLEEALLGGCKITGQFGPGAVGCSPGGTSCHNITS